MLKRCALFWTAIPCFLLVLGLGQAAHGQALTVDLEAKLISNVGAAWVTVPLENTYSKAIVTCTYNLAVKTNPSATTRVKSVTSNSFDVRIQQFENSSTVTPGNVHCLIADEGVYNLPSGLKFEAHSIVSDETSGNSVPNTWSLTNIEEVTSNVIQSYSAPVILGQVMTFNDAKASVFWSNNCTNRGNPPYVGNSRMCVGKHIGQINGTRANETLGYIVAETGSGTINDIVYELARGADSIVGVGNSPPYNYSLGDDYDIGILHQDGEDGGQGGWAVLYGADPLTPNTVSMAIEEEVVAGDKSRSHTTEQVGYWVFKDLQNVNLETAKTVALSSVSISPFAIPGSDVIYTITAENTGSKSVDADSVVIIDALPPEVVLHYADIDGPGPEAGVTIFDNTGSGLSYNEATDLKFSNAPSAPTSFADCTYTPASVNDTTVTFICFNPKGTFKSGSFSTSSFSLSFRAKIE